MEALINSQHTTGAMCLKLRQLWSEVDFNLISDGEINEAGTTRLYQALDRTIRYADWRMHEAEQPTEVLRVPQGRQQQRRRRRQLVGRIRPISQDPVESTVDDDFLRI